MNVFPEFYLFSECNSVRIGQNIQNEVMLETSIFANVVAYQFIPCELRLFDAPRKVAKAQWTYQQPSRGGGGNPGHMRAWRGICQLCSLILIPGWEDWIAFALS